MMQKRPILQALILWILTAAGFEAVAGPGLGRPAPQESTVVRDIFPDGTGLPRGRGTARRGEALYHRQCLSCHGPDGEGAGAAPMAGDYSLTGPHPVQTIGNYWPYAPMLYDLIRRSMPMNAPGSLSAEDTYALSAYILYLSGLVDYDQELDAATLADLRMPNRDGFLPVDAQP